MKLEKVRNGTSRLWILAMAVATTGAVSVANASIEYEESFDWSVVYEAGELPGNENALQYGDGTSGAFIEEDVENLNLELINGLLKIDSVDIGRLIIDARQESRFLIDFDLGFTAEFRARLIETRNTTGTPDELQGAALQLNDGREGEPHTVHLGMFTWPPESGHNWVQMRGGDRTEIIPIRDDFQTYTITAEGSEVILYINGQEVATVPPWLVIERPEVWMGDIGASGHTGHFEVDYLRIYDGGAVAPLDAEPYVYPEPFWIESWPEPLPKIVDLARDGHEFQLSFETIVGGTYRIDSRDELGEAPNEPPQTLVGDGGIVTATDDIAGVDRRFYQVAREPATIEYEESFEWDMLYEGDVDPLAEDSVQFSDGTGSFEKGHGDVENKYKIEDGILNMFINFPRGTFELSTAEEWSTGLWIDAEVGYTAEFRARIRHSDHWGAVSLQINAGNWDQNHLMVLGFETTEVEIEEENGEPRTEVVNIPRLFSGETIRLTDHPVGEGFNTYTIVGELHQVTLFINGVEVATTEDIETGIDRNFIWLGSATGQDRTSRFDVDYLRVYAGGPVRPVSEEPGD